VDEAGRHSKRSIIADTPSPYCPNCSSCGEEGCCRRFCIICDPENECGKKYSTVVTLETKGLMGFKIYLGIDTEAGIEDL
jgi:hypothetical protein